jgi:predicted phosphodiesterase
MNQNSIWGLVSDVHGNYRALERALDVLETAGAEKLAFLGDYLGRGDGNERCVARIRGVADVAIVGNRDLDWQDRVSVASRDWVLTLPRTARVGPLLLAHGDPRLTPLLSTAQIGRDFAGAWREMERDRAQVWAFGHSHHARVWRKSGEADPAELLSSTSIELEAGYRYFLNVGTTGLPFANKGGPSVAIVDLDRAWLRHLALESGSK